VVSIGEVKEALYSAFDTATEMVENDDYQIDRDNGMLHRIGTWLAGINTVRVIYTGGYTVAPEFALGSDYTTGEVVQYAGYIFVASEDITDAEARPYDDDAPWTQQVGEVPLPADLEQAAIQQSAFVYRRRNDLGISASGTAGGDVTHYAKDELLSGVREIITAHTRFVA